MTLSDFTFMMLDPERMSPRTSNPALRGSSILILKNVQQINVNLFFFEGLRPLQLNFQLGARKYSTVISIAYLVLDDLQLTLALSRSQFT